MLNGAKVTFEKVSGSDFQPIPMDKYTVQVTDVNYVKQFNSFKQIEQEVLNYEFTVLDNKTMEVEDADGKKTEESIRGRKLWRRCTPKFGKKTTMLELASAALGHVISDKEQDTFQAEDIIDKQVDVMVTVKPGSGENADKMYNNILSFAVTKKELPPFDNDKSKEAVGRESKPVAMDETESDDFINGLNKDADETKAEK